MHINAMDFPAARCDLDEKRGVFAETVQRADFQDCITKDLMDIIYTQSDLAAAFPSLSCLLAALYQSTLSCRLKPGDVPCVTPDGFWIANGLKSVSSTLANEWLTTIRKQQVSMFR